jgi:F-type H+-transporting ATPase subunit delta
MSDSVAALPEVSAVVSDETLALARRYAEALVGAAAKSGQVDALLDEFAEIQRDVLAAFPRFGAILASPRVPAHEKDRMLTQIFEKRASPLALSVLRVLNRRGRLDLLNLVLREARTMWDRQNRRISVRVQAAVPLADGQLQALRDRLARLSGATPTLHVTVDPELIGGLVVQIGDHRYDASVKTRLEQLRQRLIEGKTHEIQSRRDQFSYSA